jgi:hypothetical protein
LSCDNWTICTTHGRRGVNGTSGLALDESSEIV